MVDIAGADAFIRDDATRNPALLNSLAKPPLTLRLCEPRGFCAGVDRAIQIVVLALKKHGAPVYVRHEIVHNRYVVEGLRNLGAVFVRELDQVPDDGQPVVFSAHGVPKTVPAEAQRRDLLYLDATCPLVSKVHKQAMLHVKRGRHVLLIGHKGHPEVVGTMGQLEKGTISLIETEADVENFVPADPAALGFVTQTTLSVDDTAGIVAALQAKFPLMTAPSSDSICYATTNRQDAVRVAAPGADVFLIVGAPNSSNSMRLVEVATRAGSKSAHLVQRATDIPFEAIHGGAVVAMSAGASAPEIIVDEIVDALRERYEVAVELVRTAIEDENFPVVRSLRETPLEPRDMAFVNGGH